VRDAEDSGKKKYNKFLAVEILSVSNNTLHDEIDATSTIYPAS
jgi:hypothetical protein